jgi:hypothetical protein
MWYDVGQWVERQYHIAVAYVAKLLPFIRLPASLIPAACVYGGFTSFPPYWVLRSFFAAATCALVALGRCGVAGVALAFPMALDFSIGVGWILCFVDCCSRGYYHVAPVVASAVLSCIWGVQCFAQLYFNPGELEARGSRAMSRSD